MDTKRRSYDIYDIEERVHALELGGGDTPSPGGSWDYSTEEVNTGQKWVDGKDIYCKTFVFESPITITGAQWTSLIEDFGISNIIEGVVLDDETKGAYVGLFGISSNYVKVYLSTGGKAHSLILRYTKSTTSKSSRKKR